MSLYQVPPPEEVEPFSALQATRRRLTLWLAGLSSIACMLVWWYDGSNGLNSPWAATAVPIIATGLVLGGLVIPGSVSAVTITGISEGSGSLLPNTPANKTGP